MIDETESFLKALFIFTSLFIVGLALVCGLMIGIESVLQ